MHEEEQVLPIPGANGYLVSDFGNVYSVRNGRFRRMRTWVNNHGYHKVDIVVGGTRKKVYVHRLVLLTFRGTAPEGMEAMHLDGNHTNNRLVNLDWGTHTQNMRDMIKHGHHISVTHHEKVARGENHGWVKHPESIRKGENSPSATITETHVIVIRGMLKLGFGASHIARSLHITRDVVRGIQVGHSWKSVQLENQPCQMV